MADRGCLDNRQRDTAGRQPATAATGDRVRNDPPTWLPVARRPGPPLSVARCLFSWGDHSPDGATRRATPAPFRYSPPVSGVVYLVGAGPGDPGLITRRGADLVARADVVVYDGLASPVLLRLARSGCELVYAGKKHAPAGEPPLTQGAIDRLLIERARAGKQVVRLKGGDPFVFGRGAEECEALAVAGVRFEIVPGVSAATGVAAYAGIPLTARGIASSVAYATGHEAEADADGKGRASAIDWRAIAGADTVVLFMALSTAADCCARLIAAGRDPATPAAAIHWGTTAAQRTIVAALADLPGAIRATGLRPPALLVVGDVVRLRQRLSWFEDRPLAGARVLVTRAPDQAERFSHALAELGAEPLHCPLTRLADPPPEEAARLDAALAHLGQFAWLVLSSANAVERFVDALTARQLDGRALAGVRIACVGAATASALAARGLIADLVPPHGDAAGVARAIIETSGGGLAGERVLVPRAAEGRDEAVDLLRAAGAEVDAIAIYGLARVGPEHPAVAHALARLRAREVRAAAFFAPSQVRALCDLLGTDAADVLRAVPILAAIGATTAAALAARGLTVQVVPHSPDAEVLAAEIAAAAGGAAAAARRHSPPAGTAGTAGTD
jgi:uroporphyrinogen III methyltransferase / synthase